MGMFARVTDIFKANINDLLDRAEDPEKMLKQMVLEMEESVNKTTLAVASSIANHVNLQKKLDKAKADRIEWEKKAMQAITANRDDLAKAALEKKSQYERNITDLEPLTITAKQTSDNLRIQLDKLKSKLDEARTRQSTLVARSQAAKAQKQIAQSLSGVGSDAFSKFNKLEEKVEKMEAEATAFEQLAGESSSLEDEFKQLEASSVDADLLALKAKMGLLPENGENQ
jgi:phage shock protein A